MSEEELLFKNETYRNDKMINVLKKTLEFNEKFLETLENKKTGRNILTSLIQNY